MNLWELFREGGFIMWPLLLFSVASWCVIIEKFITIKKFKELSQSVFDEVITLIENNKVDEAKEVCLKTGSDLVSAPMLAYFQGAQSDDKAQRRVSDTLIGLRRYMWVLGTVSTSAPFVGLFGTVVGIIKSFDAIATAGKGGFAVVAAGISEALIATAAGILVAVIAVIFFNYFQTTMNTMMASYKNRLEDLRDHLVKG